MIKNREAFKSIDKIDKFWEERVKLIRESCKGEKYANLRESLEHLEKHWSEVISGFRATMRDIIGIEEIIKRIRRKK